MEQTLANLQRVVTAAKKKKQNTSLDKYELLWDCEKQLEGVSVENAKALEGRILQLLVNEVILQDPTPPLQRVVSLWIVKLCSITGSMSQALTSLKSFQNIIQQQKAPLSAKMASLECIGQIYTGLGRSLGSAASETVTLMIKQFKSSFVEKKEASLVVLQKIVASTGSSGVFLHVQILKAIKMLMNDKEAKVRLEIAKVLGIIGSYCSVGNVEAVLSLAGKLCEEPSPHTRSSAATAIGNCLSMAFHATENAPTKKDSSGNPLFKDWTIKASLDHLKSMFLKGSGAKKESRAGITLAVENYLQQLPARVIRAEMNVIVQTILSLLLNPSMKYYGSLSELLQAHLCTGHMINDGLRDRLGEEGQKKMAEVLISVLTKDGYNEYILILALRQLSYLFLDLGQGAAPLWDSVEIPLSKLLSHPSYSVRGVCAVTARSLATALPDYHAKLLRAYLNVTTMEFAQLASCKPEEVKFHLGPLQGNAYAVAGLISLIPHSVLGVPDRITKFSLEKARTLIEIDPSCKFAAMVVARTEAGWSMVSALMTLGPNFVERMLVELLEMWDRCFKGIDQKVQPTTEKAIVVFSRLKSCALEALCNFIRHNKSLLGADIIERAVMWLKNILGVLTGLPKLPNSQGSTTDIINVLKANIVKSFAALPVDSYPICYVPLMTWIIHEVPRNATTSLFRSLLQTDDSILGPWLEGKQLRDAKLIQSPAVVVHDHSVVWSSDPEKELTNPHPTSKRLVDEILDLFPKLYMVQSIEHQQTILMHFMRCVKECPAELKSSLQTNVFCLFLKTFSRLNEKKKALPKGKFLKPLLIFIESFLSCTDVALRRAAAECIGLLALLQGDKFTDHIINSINQTLKVSKDSLARAGCGFSLACIIRKLGGMRSAYHLPATVSILHVLAKDASPLVHVWALHSLWITVETTSLSFAPFATPTLSLALSLLLSPDCSTSATYQPLGRLVNACISCLGPELQPDSSSFRSCRAVISELQENEDPHIQLESIHFQQMLALFAPQIIHMEDSLAFLRIHLHSRFISLRRATVICLRQLVQINAEKMLKCGGERLEEELLRMLDKEKDVDLRNELQLLIRSMIEYLGAVKVKEYLDLFRTVISSSTSRRGVGVPGKSSHNTMNEEDEEEEEVVDASGKLTESSDNQEDDSVFVPRWRTRVFCMECIGTLIDVIAYEKKSKPEHFDMALGNRNFELLAQQQGKDLDNEIYNKDHPLAQKYLVYHLADLVSISFNCSTSPIRALRPVGVKVLQNIVERFAEADDPQYEGHKLLELYAAQVAAALRPAFHKDRSPLLTAAATDVVVSFVRNTITADESALRKVTKLLTSFVDTVETLEYPSYSERASTMVQLKILGAIARLYGETVKESSGTSFLSGIIEPFLPKLCRLWMLMLRDWTILSTQTSSVTKAYKGTFYTFSSIAFVMGYYRDVCASILLAQSSLLHTPHWRDSEFEEKQENSPSVSLDDFSILVGLSVSCLVDCTSSTEDTKAILECCSFLFTSDSFVTPKYFPLEQWLELSDAFQIQLQVGNNEVKSALLDSVRKIISCFPLDYYQDSSKERVLREFIHAMVEIIVHPLQKNISKKGRKPTSLLLSSSLLSLPDLSNMLTQSSLFSSYAGSISFLIQRNLALLPMDLLSKALATLSYFVKTPQILVSFFHSVLQDCTNNQREQAADDASWRKALCLISLISLSSSCPVPMQLHTQSFKQLSMWLNGSVAKVRKNILSSLLHWFQSSPSLASDSIALWYLQHLATWAVRYLFRLKSPSSALESFILDAIKVLVLTHATASESSKPNLLSLLLPTLISLLDPSMGKEISKLSLTVIQSLAATDSVSFKTIADALPSSHRQLLENAASNEQKQAQPTSKRSKRAQRTKPVKELTLDFAQFD